jgi:hypothetical protein
MPSGDPRGVATGTGPGRRKRRRRTTRTTRRSGGKSTSKMLKTKRRMAWKNQQGAII